MQYNGTTVGYHKKPECSRVTFYGQREQRMTGNWGSFRWRFPVCVHMFEGQSWLDAHTNPALLLSDVKDHLGGKACYDGAKEWFMPQTSGRSWSQYKQLQLSWCILCACVFVVLERDEERQHRNTAVWPSWDLSSAYMFAVLIISSHRRAVMIQCWEDVGWSNLALKGGQPWNTCW